MIRRNLVAQIKKIKTKYPVLALTGPRQSGKTTLLKEALEDYTYISLEDLDIRKFAKEDPRGFLETYSTKVIFDEVQRVPELFSYIQTKVDREKKMGNIILSGSQNFGLMRAIQQSLAGRVALFKLYPLDLTELDNAKLLKKSVEETMVKGAYPAIYDRKIPSSTFYKNYIDTYIARDVPEILNVQDHSQFKIFIAQIAGQAGQLLNLNTLAKDTAISPPTAKAWLSLLESSYLCFRLNPYFNNFKKRTIKSPKVFFYDTGLLCYLLGIRTKSDLQKNHLFGSIYENFIVSELEKNNAHFDQGKEFWFWRDSHGKEIDLLYYEKNTFQLMEIKGTQTVKSEHFKHLHYFQELSKSKVKKHYYYMGNERYTRSGIEVKNWKSLIHNKSKAK